MLKRDSSLKKYRKGNNPLYFIFTRYPFFLQTVSILRTIQMPL